jgi:general stress protein YciG
LFVDNHICLRAILGIDNKTGNLLENVGGELVLTVESEQGKKMTREEAGRKGGRKVARERNSEFYREIGRKGGEKVAEERGTEFYRKIGRKGGESRGNRNAVAKGGRTVPTKKASANK